MLRTCSLPDLSRVFSPRQESAGANDASDANDANAAPDNPLEIEDLEEAAKDEEQSEAEDAYEDEDLRDIRASMELLLQEEEGKGDFNGNPPEELFRVSAEIQQHSRMAVDDEEEEDEEEEEEEDDDEEAGGALTNGAEENLSNIELNEEWQSDGSGEEGVCEASHSDSIFSRLEELRFRLEQQMGFEKFIEAYNKIKANHEDEDENM
ncbi:serine/threonine-protein kinase Nek1-like, partial [Notothenia coriiceps]|uniref:Serine/threonine-protein kinase Nek1-like n=1 Tax=Notothenia coriiceps TaxID=8208 RepID=A0A6I9PT52_9TELE